MSDTLNLRVDLALYNRVVAEKQRLEAANANLRAANELQTSMIEAGADESEILMAQIHDLTAAAEVLQGECGRLREIHDPQWDGTDAACDCYWRAHEYTANEFCRLVTKILDGKDDGTGFNYEPWHSLRRRLLALTTGGQNEPHLAPTKPEPGETGR